MQKGLLVFLFLILSCGKDSGGEVVPATTASAPVRPVTKNENMVAGMATMVVQDDEVRELSVSGVRKAGEETPLASTDRFHLGSCTKAMTATLVGVLVEEEALRWESTLKELLPQLSLHPAFDGVTLEELLAHRSGVSRNLDDNLWAWLQSPGLDPVKGREGVATRLLAKAPASLRGRFSYSNAGYVIVGHVLERLTGKSWEELMREKIFSPLGMKSCGFGPGTEPWGHYKNSTLRPVRFDNPATYNPATSVHCSLADWNKFLREHMKGLKGKDGLVGAETMRKLHTPYPATDTQYTYGAWGYGERVWARGPVLTHNGSNTVNFALVWLAPKKNLILTSVTNTGGSDAEKALTRALEARAKRY